MEWWLHLSKVSELHGHRNWVVNVWSRGWERARGAQLEIRGTYVNFQQ